MISAELHAPTPRPQMASTTPPRLVLNRLTIKSTNQFGTDLKDVSISLAGGEILGIAALRVMARAS